uniref:Uncharacterized protein n=1 Tax=Utricularia reniformis TaxID=192314 RepID=A0A1Y0B0Y0_9LAMI|nr:hypothetical protein AEK19_MT0782 [Utricularia reniformis]ART31023.1 hypothetical protein AEK19_MT0782 [Utricularia reniformis]
MLTIMRKESSPECRCWEHLVLLVERFAGVAIQPLSIVCATCLPMDKRTYQWIKHRILLRRWQVIYRSWGT